MSERWSTRRRATDAARRFERAVLRLSYDAESDQSDSVRWLAGYEAEALLASVLSDAILLVEVLNEDEDDYSLERLERYARALRESLRARRLAAKLGQVAGRVLGASYTYEGRGG